MTSPTIYDIGTVTLTNGSAEVSGDGTAWAINGVVGGVFSCGGMSVPIASVDDDETLTLAYPWPGSNASGAAYAISLINSQAADTIWANRHWSRVVGQALLAAIRPDASGTLAERDALNPMLDNGQWFARAEPPHDLEFYRKVPAGWEGPFTTRGIGGVGEGGLGIPSPGAAGMLPWYSAPNTISLTALTAFARTLLDDADAATMRNTLNVQRNLSHENAIEFGYALSGDRQCYMDFHASNSVDYSFRIARGAGVNGNVAFTNVGTGRISLNAKGGAQINGSDIVTTAQIPGQMLGSVLQQKFPSGGIILCGTHVASLDANSQMAITFPFAFPNAGLYGVASSGDVTVMSLAQIGAMTTTGFTVRSSASPNTGPYRINYVAWGR